MPKLEINTLAEIFWRHSRFVRKFLKNICKNLIESRNCQNISNFSQLSNIKIIDSSYFQGSSNDRFISIFGWFSFSFFYLILVVSMDTFFLPLWSNIKLWSSEDWIYWALLLSANRIDYFYVLIHVPLSFIDCTGEYLWINIQDA